MIQEKTLYYPPVLSCIPACQRSSQRCQRALCVTVTRRKQKNGPVCTDSYTRYSTRVYIHSYGRQRLTSAQWAGSLWEKTINGVGCEKIEIFGLTGARARPHGSWGGQGGGRKPGPQTKEMRTLCTSTTVVGRLQARLG